MEEDTAEAEPVPTLQAIERLMQYAEADGDISPMLEESELAELASEVCEQYERDKQSREEWEKVAEKALRDMTRADHGAKDYPWANASNVHYPLLAYAVMQFNARAYPAIVKGDEAVNCKVVGSDEGLPQMGPDGQPVMQVQGMPVVPTPAGPAVMTQQGPQPLPQGAQPEPMWKREPGAKAKRAQRVRNFLNYQLFYRMDDWEGETDTLLFQMPAIGCGFRKQWFNASENQHESRFVPAMKLVVDNDAKTLESAPQIAEEIDGVYPHTIKRDIAIGKYRDIGLDPEEKDARMLLEVQCYHDLDEDGIDEPYIVTIDHKGKSVLRVVPDFGPEQVKLRDGKVAYIERSTFYTKYEFLPHPEGKFYNPGLAHLLDQYGEVINTIINQMLDANHAATAGGGFIASGLRIQGQGQSSTLKFRPGEYKSVSVTGAALKDGIVDRTVPHLSPVMFQLLDLILGAARDIASVKDVLSGEASNQGQVGTTLALIEQGLQVFTAIYKRVYRGLKAEFQLLFDNVSKYADEQTMQDYMNLLDDPAANFAEDFNGQDMDIRPVSDPTSVTKIQQMARAQFLFGTVQTLAAVGGDAKEALRRMYEAADVEDIDKLLPPPQPNPMQEMAAQLDMKNKDADTRAKLAKAAKDEADAMAKGASVQYDFAKLDSENAQAVAQHQIDVAKTQIDAFKVGADVGGS